MENKNKEEIVNVWLHKYADGKCLIQVEQSYVKCGYVWITEEEYEKYKEELLKYSKKAWE